MTNKPIRITLILLFTVFSFAAKAQRGKQTSLSVGSEIIVPLNMDYWDHSTDVNVNAGFGVNLKLETPINETLHFTVATGFVFTQSNPRYSYFDASSSNTFYQYGYHNLYAYLPVTAGLKYYWTKYFYANAEAGSAFSIDSRAYTSFVYAGGAGAVVPIGPHHGFDFNLQFERGYKNTDHDHRISQLGLNVAYKYRF